MSENSDQQSHSSSASTGLKIFVLALFAIVTAIVAVSFTAHHMRIGFEKEYADQVERNVTSLAATCSLSINGDDILLEPSLVTSKYKAVLPALIVDTGDANLNRKYFGLYSYTNGALNPLVRNSETELLAMNTKVSEWLTVESKPYVIEKPGQTTILSPIRNSLGEVVGVFELSETYTFLEIYGNAVEQRVFMSGIASVFVGIFLFSLQYFLPVILRIARKRGEKI